MCDSVGRFESGDDALRSSEEVAGVFYFFIGCSDILYASSFVQIRMSRSDADIVEAGADGVRGHHIAIIVLDKIGFIAFGDSWRSMSLKAYGVFSDFCWIGSTGFDSDESNSLVIEKCTKTPQRIATSADTGDTDIRMAYSINIS